jgi:hypothetical protein
MQQSRPFEQVGPFAWQDLPLARNKASEQGSARGQRQKSGRFIANIDRSQIAAGKTSPIPTLKRGVVTHFTFRTFRWGDGNFFRFYLPA